MNSLKSQLRNRNLTIGSWITIGHTSIAEIMAKAGFDWLTVDMEHSAITLHQAQQLIQVIELAGVTPLVRVGSNDSSLIKRVMDAGAHGVIIPMVNDRKEAEAAVRAVKYPPIGTRGVGLARAQGYGATFEEYKKWVNSESIVIVQIEHIKAVENLEDILKVEEVDAFIIGPYDLSGSLGVPGQFDHPDVIAALKEVKEISRRLKKTSGFHVIPPRPEAVLEKYVEGYRFLAYSLDILFLGESCREGLEELRKKTTNDKS
ncbi:2,4-dihydroxyhept-2-ene-1,7-dioic acid aldolase [Peptococcaceae bacterium SCADC1_2_3]|nr:2,4-dihydroxyhept-2-ene-1,7-dioic acid aldolase [Peptococcaceae bacterium SCADC1_2_3]KFI37695.1 2,4-dihydroxyhept-2-ene-1,7-dioic acid aldolase [Peptococcaceae bacterium SCADC1_2_3]